MPDIAKTMHGMLAQVYGRARADAHPDLIRLNVGDTYLKPHPAALSQAQTLDVDPAMHNYPPVAGMAELIDAIVTHHQGRVDRHAIQVTAGATSGLAHVVNALVDPGDEIIVLAPFWPLIRGIINLGKGPCIEVPFYDRLDTEGHAPAELLDTVEAAIGPRTRALYINDPNNPTGAVLAENTKTALLQLAVKHDLWLIADEAYEDLVFAGEHRPLWQLSGAQERTVVAHTFSKSFGLAGARVGYLHGPPSVMQAVRAIQTHSTYAASRPMQWAATRALEPAHAKPWIATARQRYHRAADITTTALKLPPVRAGTFVFFRANNGTAANMPPVLDACAAAGVALTPGSACGAAYSDYIRLCFTAVPPDRLKLALERLQPVLAGA